MGVSCLPKNIYVGSICFGLLFMAGCQTVPSGRTVTELRQEAAELPQPVSRCTKPKAMTDELLTRYQEVPIMFFTKGQLIYLIYASPVKSSWSFVALQPGKACLVDTGQGFGKLVPEPEGKGT